VLLAEISAAGWRDLDGRPGSTHSPLGEGPLLIKLRYCRFVLKPGDKAPDFTLLDQAGNKFSLSKSLKSRKVWHLVYFYPKADTPGCTTQACGLRDVLGQIGDTAVVGISPDAPAKQAKFDQKYGLGFPLLADEEHEVAEAYGVWKEKSMYGRKFMGIERSAFLIDEKGKLEQVWYKISPKDTPVRLTESLAASGKV
jgi:peroxiredoxin Q/BCP